MRLNKNFLLIFVLIFVGCATYKNKPLVEKFNYSKINSPITPEKAVYLSLKYNPDLKIERAKYSVQKSILLNAGILENPELSQDIVIPVKNKSSDTVNGFDLGLSWNTNNIFTSNLLKKAAKLKNEEVLLRVIWKEWLISEKAKLTTYNLIFLEKRKKIAQNLLNSVNLQLNQIKSFVNKGLLDISYLYKFQSKYLSAKNLLNNLNSEIIRKEYELKTLIGYPPDESVSIKEIPVDLKIKIPEYKTLIESLNKNRPDIIALKKAYNENELLLHSSIIEQFPSINLSFSYSKDTDKLYSIVPGISFSLPIFNHNQAKIAKFRAKREELFYEFNTRIYRARTNISKILMLIKKDKNLISDISNNIKNLQAQFIRTKKSLKIGEASIIDIYSLQNQINLLKLLLLSAQNEYLKLIILLEMETGKKLIN